MLDPDSASEEPKKDADEYGYKAKEDCEANTNIDVRDAQKTPAKGIDHVENWIKQ